jgi:hypothetical protein
MPDRLPGAHVADLLPDLVNARLPQAMERRARAHLTRCAACQAELRAWEHIAAVECSAAKETLAPPPAVLERVWAEVDRALAAVPVAVEPPHGIGWRHAVRVLTSQMRVLRRTIWVASAAGIALATVCAAALAPREGQQEVLVLALPLIAATGVAFLYGPETDPGLELALAAPTSPRLVAGSRFAVLFGFDLLCSLVSTLALSLALGEGFWPLAALWLGPMALLSSLSLAVSLLAGPLVAAGATLALWASRLLRLGAGVELQSTSGPLWSTSPAVLALAMAVFALSLYLAPRREALPLREG